MTQYQSMFSKPPLADDNNNNNNNGSGSNSNFQQVTFGQLPTSSFNNNDNNNNGCQYDPNRQLNYAYPSSGGNVATAHLQQQQSNVPMQGNNTGCSLFASPATTMHPQQQQQQHLHRSNFGNNPIMWSCGQSLSRSLIDQICASGSTPVLILPCETGSSSNNNSSIGSSQQPSQQSSSIGMTNYCCCCCRIRGLSAPTQLINNFCACKSDGNGVMMQPELHFKSNTNDNSNGYTATWMQAEKTANQQQQQQQQAAAASLSIQLQAIVSQLMGIQGIAATVVCKLLLKNVVEARVQETPEELMDKATRCLQRLNLEQLMEESRRCQEVAGLVRVYLIWASNSPQLIPILTGAQLRINTIKSCLEMLINARVVQDQSAGVQQGGQQQQQQQDKQEEPIDEAILNLKSNDELLQLLAQLREKECQERVNLSFNQPYGSQKLLYQRKLDNCQRKIQQIERELNRRRDSNTVHDYPGKEPVTRSSEVQRPTLPDQDQHQAYDLFVDSSSESNFCVERPKRLLLKPHVGSPETTYDERRPEENVCVNCNNDDCDNAKNNNHDDDNDNDNNDNNSDGKSVDRAHG